MPSQMLVLCLQWITLAGSALTAAKLFQTGLFRRYPAFFRYFVYQSLNGIWPLFLSSGSRAYFYLWISTEPVNWLFYFLVVKELCRLVLEKHRGLYTLGRWAMSAATIVALLLSVLSLVPRIPPPKHKISDLMPWVLAADRGITLGLAVFLLVLMFLLRKYPVTLSRNVVLHATLYATFFISNTLDVAISSALDVKLYALVDTGFLIVSAGCVLTWLFCLNPSGETVPVKLPFFRPEDEQRILDKLESLNGTILKLSRH